MARLIEHGVLVPAAGGKRIEELVGHLASGTGSISIARMRSPSGWVEPGQAPAFDEFTLVLEGSLRVETRAGTLDVAAGQAVSVPAHEWVRYSSPGEDGAEYIAICLPAFAPGLANRDEA